MIGTFFLDRGRLASLDSAYLPLDDGDLAYGYGCYETLKVRGGLLYFPEHHAERLLSSARILGIECDLDEAGIVTGLKDLILSNGIADCNLKMLLIGRTRRQADWYAFLLPPLQPSAEAVAQGVTCSVYPGERHFPAAKSLSMLLSTVAFREASSLGAWDALLENRRGEFTEGTRTNLLFIDRKRPGQIFTPPFVDCLPGITRKTIGIALAEAGRQLEEAPLSREGAAQGRYGIAVTSTSSRILRVQRLIGIPGYLPPQPGDLSELETLYGSWLSRYETSLRSAG